MVNNGDILKNVLLKMNYDPSKTLKENIEEQSMGGMITPQYMSDPKNVKDLRDSFKSIGEFISDPHVFLPIAAAVAGIMTGGVGGLVIGGILELADVALYIKEKDYTSAGIGLVFSLIPMGMLLPKLGVGKIASQEVKVLLNKLKKGLDLTNKEKKIIKSIDENKKWITKTLTQQSSKILSRKILSKYTGKKLLIAILYMVKYGLLPYRFGWRVAALGGGFFTALQIGKILGIAIQGIDYRTVELPVKYTTLPKEKKEVVKKQILKQVTDQSPEIKNIAQNEMDNIINTSDEEKVIQINNSLADLDEELDKIIK
jgi:hypothetical protein